MIDEAKLREWREACEKATPGPWKCWPGILKHYVASENDDFFFGLWPFFWRKKSDAPVLDTARFIALSRAALPALLDEVERLRKELNEANACIYAMHDHGQDMGDAWIKDIAEEMHGPAIERAVDADWHRRYGTKESYAPDPYVEAVLATLGAEEARDA